MKLEGTKMGMLQRDNNEKENQQECGTKTATSLTFFYMKQNFINEQD